MPRWVDEGYHSYAKRLGRECRLELREIPAGRRSGAGGGEQAREREAERLLRAIPGGDRVIALDERGQAPSTQELARRLDALMHAGGDLSLLVGGPDGLAERCRRRADETWSLSRLTLPHALVRVLLAEQLYRAWSLLRHHPYHRD